MCIYYSLGNSYKCLIFNHYYIQMIEIKPIKVWRPVVDANYLRVRPIIGSTTDKSCNTYYEIGMKTANSRVKDVVTKDEEGNDIITPTTIIDWYINVVLQTGNHQITEEEYAERWLDNTYIEDIVLDYLGLERL